MMRCCQIILVVALVWSWGVSAAIAQPGQLPLKRQSPSITGILA